MQVANIINASKAKVVVLFEKLTLFKKEDTIIITDLGNGYGCCCVEHDGSGDEGPATR